MSIDQETPAIISRREAKAQDKTTYFTGKPCKRGHIALRQLNGTCVLCAPDYKAGHAQRQQERDPEGYRATVRAAVKRHYANNKAAILEKKRDYYLNNQDALKAKAKARRDAKKADKASTAPAETLTTVEP